MIKIKFNNEEILKEVTFSKTGNTITLTGITDENTSGFLTFRMNEDQLGDFSNYTTIYDKGENYITFSNDGSTISDIKNIDLPEEPVDNKTPTELEKINAQVMYTALMTDTLLEEEESDA